MVQKCDCLPWGPLRRGGRSIFQIRKVEGLWEVAEVGDVGKRERREERRKVMREGSSKKWDVFAGFCPSLELLV